jgi:transposase
MLTRVQKTHPALKHGGYSATTILPGEDSASFEKLRRELIAEFSPEGALEHDVVATIARLVWRKQNLATFRLAALVREHRNAIRSKRVAAVEKKYRRQPLPPSSEEERILRLLEPDHEFVADERKRAVKNADRQAREELGEAYELAEIGEPTTVDRLLQDLGVEERLDAMIDKCLKRLLFLRGLKSLPTAFSSASPPLSESQLIPGPTKAGS